ncbi:MAG: L-threonylcarbamoyladenylate synthase [Flavobacteriales bacterium]
MEQSGTDITKASELLKEGKIVGIPTETVYGLAADALNAAAVVSIFEAKQRPSFDPLIVHIGAVSQLKQLVGDVSPLQQKLIDKFWPGPLTIIFDKNEIIPDIVTSGLKTVGIRMPQHPITLKLLRDFDLCLAAPSANPFGYISPTSADHVIKQLGDKVEYVLDGGPSEIGLESTIVRCDNHQITVLRLGGLSIDALSDFGVPVVVSDHSSSSPQAPGMLTNHYSPRKKTSYLHSASEIAENTAVLYFSKESQRAVDRTLSKSGDLREAARNLFKYLRELDELEITEIFVEKAPDNGLGKAINDRLKRATAS